MVVHVEVPGTPVEARKATAHRTCPDRVLMIYEQRHDAIVGQASGVAVAMPVVGHDAARRADCTQPAAECRNPESAIGISREGGGVSVTERAGRFARLMTERPGPRVPVGGATGLGSDPQPTAVLVQRDH